MTSDYTCTLYQLFLGDQEATTGWYLKGYTEASILEAHFLAGTAVTIGGQGYYTRYDWTGFTEYDVNVGDVIVDSFDRAFEIKSVKPWTNGDVFAFNELELEQLPYFSLPTSSARFFGFEDTEHGTIGYGFEDGFERGYWTEITY